MNPLTKVVPSKRTTFSSSSQQAINVTLSEKVDNAVDKKVKDEFYLLEEKISAKLEARETKTLEVLAVFITLFTFISVNINIFTRISDIYTAIWFMFLMTICSIIIVSSLLLLSNNKRRSLEIIAVVLALIILTAWLIVPQLSMFNLRLNPTETKVETSVIKNDLTNQQLVTPSINN